MRFPCECQVPRPDLVSPPLPCQVRHLTPTFEHKDDFVEGFTKKYGMHTLVYFEACKDHESVLLREKQIKEWEERRWKLEFAEKANPEWSQ